MPNAADNHHAQFLSDESSSRDSVTLFYLVLLLAHFSRRTKGKDAGLSFRAFEMLSHLTSAFLCDKNKKMWRFGDILMGCRNFPANEEYFPTKGITTDSTARLILEAIGVELKTKGRGDFNTWGLSLESSHMFGFLLYSGRVPFPILCGLSALLEDGVSRGNAIVPYEESLRPAGALRARVTKADKALAFSRFLTHPEFGLKRSMERKEGPRENLKRPLKDDSKAGADDDSHVTPLELSQMCTISPSKCAKVSHYVNVVREASVIL